MKISKLKTTTTAGSGRPASACSPWVVCEAVTYMDKLGYGGSFKEAEKRASLGEVQTYCQTCGLCRWPEEQRTCSHFVRSEELETFYANEANKQI